MLLNVLLKILEISKRGKFSLALLSFGFIELELQNKFVAIL